MEPERRVCPDCGEPAGQQPFCASCGRNLTSVERLPSRSEWEAAQPSASPAPPDPPTGLDAWREGAGVEGVAPASRATNPPPSRSGAKTPGLSQRASRLLGEQMPVQAQFDLPIGQADVMALVLGDFTQSMLKQRYSLASHSEGAAVFARRRASGLGAVGGLIGGGVATALWGGGVGGIILDGAAVSAFNHHKDAVAITALERTAGITTVSIVGRGPAGTHEAISELRKQLVLVSLQGAPAVCPRCGKPQGRIAFCAACSAALKTSARAPEPQTEGFAASFQQVLTEVYAERTAPAALLGFGPADCPIQQVLHGTTGTLGEAVTALEKFRGALDATVEGVQCDGERFWITTTFREPLPGRAIESIKPNAGRIGDWLVWSEFGER